MDSRWVLVNLNLPGILFRIQSLGSFQEWGESHLEKASYLIFSKVLAANG